MDFINYFNQISKSFETTNDKLGSKPKRLLFEYEKKNNKPLSKVKYNIQDLTDFKQATEINLKNIEHRKINFLH